MRYPHPPNEDAFEDFCLELLREHLRLPTLERYGHRGEEQHGVDLIDTGGAVPLIGVQCKHHKPNDPIPASEIEAEVEKAKGFPEALGEYYILTSAKKSTRAQDKVREINTKHRATGVFIVRLFTWDDIERLIDTCPRAQETLGIGSAAGVSRLFDAQIRPVLQGLDRQENELFGAELDEIRSDLRDEHIELATIRLQKLHSRSWDKFDARTRYRWYTLRADTHFRKQEATEAARLLLLAKELQPSDEAATINEVAAYTFLGDLGKARFVATSASEAAPHSAALYACVIRTADTDAAALSYFERRPPAFADHPDIWVSTAMRSDGLDAAVAEPIARTAVSLAPSDARSWFALAATLLRSELGRGEGHAAPNCGPFVKARVQEAIDCCAKVLGLKQKGELVVPSLLRRSTLYTLIGQLSHANDDIREACKLAPNDPQVLVTFAQMEESQGRIDVAIETLRELTMRNNHNEARFLLARCLWHRNGPGDRGESVQLLSAIEAATFTFKEALTEFLVEGLLGQGQVEEARTRLVALSQLLEPCLASTMKARVENAASNQDVAEQHLRHALDTVTDTTPKPTLRKLASGLLTLGMHADALEVLNTLAAPEGSVEDLKLFVQVASQMGRHEQILQVCAAARANGLKDPYLIRNEVELLDRYDPEAALEVLQDTVHHLSSPESTRLHIAFLALRLDKHDLANEQLELLPKVDQASLHDGVAVVKLLGALHKHAEAMDYAYDLLRLHFRDPDAHRAFRQAVLFREDKLPAERASEVVAVGTAVRLEEQGLPAKWYVIEDSSIAAEHVDDEIKIDAALTAKMLGKRVGEEVLLSDGPGIKRATIVREILPKRVFRFQDVLNRWQYRFPDHQEMWMVQVTDPKVEGKADFSRLLDMLNEQRGIDPN